jgi:hypothetical protein
MFVPMYPDPDLAEQNQCGSGIHNTGYIDNKHAMIVFLIKDNLKNCVQAMRDIFCFSDQFFHEN